MTREQRISENLGLVHACAHRFTNRGFEYDDLFSAGCIGLCKAADRFDASLGYAFSTYAVPAILGEMRRLFREDGTVKISRSLKERAREAKKTEDALAKALNRAPTVREIADALKLSEFETAELLNATQPVLSLTELFEATERQKDIPVASEEENIQTRLDVQNALQHLEEQERNLITLRYFKGLTQVRTAEILGMSQVQVSRKERAILKELRIRLTG